jgi:hypothetical protein
VSAGASPAPKADNDVESIEEDLKPITENYAPTASLEVPQQPRVDTPSRLDRLLVLAGLFLLVTAGGAVLMTAAFVATDEVWIRVERATTLIVTPVLALLGSGIGWYFGKHSK